MLCQGRVILLKCVRNTIAARTEDEPSMQTVGLKKWPVLYLVRWSTRRLWKRFFFFLMPFYECFIYDFDEKRRYWSRPKNTHGKTYKSSCDLRLQNMCITRFN